MNTYVQRQCEICIEAHQQHEHGRNEVVNGSRALRRGHVGTGDRENGRKGTTDIGAEHHGAGVLERQLSGHAVDGILIDATSNCN